MSSLITVDPDRATGAKREFWPKARKAVSAKAALWVSLWSVLAVAYFVLLLPERPAIHEEGLIVCGAERILQGQLPYRDFDTGYPPAEFYTIAGVFRVLGATLLAARAWDTLWRLATMAFVFLLARSATRTQRAHPVPLICGGILSGAIGFHLYPMICGALPCMVALWCAVLYLRGRGVRWLFASGVLAGAGVLYRHDLGLCICAAVTAATFYHAIGDWRRRWLELLAVFWAGVLLVVAPSALLLWLSVPHGAIVYSFIDFPKANLIARHVPLPGPGYVQAWEDLYLPLAVTVVAAGVWARSAAAQRSVLILLLITTVSTLALATQRLDTAHAYPAIMFSLVLLCACLAELRKRTILPTLLLASTIVCYGVRPLYFLRQPVPGAVDSGHDGVAQQVAPQFPDNASRDDIARAGPVRLEPDQRNAIEYIECHLPPRKPLYVGTTSHSLQYYNDPLFYFLAARPQATRFDMFVPGVTNSAAVQLEIVRELRTKRVEYVVLFRAPFSGEPNLSSVDDGVTILDDVIRQDYVEVAQFGRYTIRRRASI